MTATTVAIGTDTSLRTIAAAAPALQGDRSASNILDMDRPMISAVLPAQ